MRTMAIIKYAFKLDQYDLKTYKEIQNMCMDQTFH